MGLFSRSRKHVPVEEQLRILAECGIRLREGVDREQVFEGISVGPDDGDEQSFELTLVMMGGEDDTDAQTGFYSNDIWHYVGEVISGCGDYACLVQRIADMAGEDFPAINIEDDSIDIGIGLDGVRDSERKRAWVACEVDGVRHIFEPNIAEYRDWADPMIFDWIDGIMRARGSARRITCYDSGGSDCLVSVMDARQMKQIRSRTGLKFAWMVPAQ